MTNIINGLNNLIGSGNPIAASPLDVPGTIPGLILWLRGDSVVSPTNGSKFSTWNDLSPLGAVYTQNTSADQFVWNASDPLFGGQPSVSSDNQANMVMSVNNAPQSLPQTIYVVFETTAVQTYQIFLTGFPDAAECGLQNGYLYTYNGVSHYGSSDQMSAGKAHLACYIINSSNGSTQCFLDDGYAPLALVSGLGACSNYNLGMYLGYEGQADGLLGNFAEIISYTGAHTLAQRTQIFNYLATRYNQPQWTTFSPYDLQPSAWYRADLGATTAGGLITALADQSGNGYNLTVNTAFGATAPGYSSNAGPNGTSVIQYTQLTTMGLSEAALPTSQTVDVFVVASTPIATAGRNALLMSTGSANNGFAEMYQGAGDIILNQTQNGGTNNNSATMKVNTPFIVEAQFLGTSSSSITMINGATSGASGNVGTGGSDTGFTLGHAGGSGSIPGPYSWTGNISECIVFNYVLSSAERTQLLNYLSARYGIAV